MPQYPYAPINQQPITALVLTAASANGNSADLTNSTHPGVAVFVNITAITGTSPTLTVAIRQKNLVTGAYTALLTSAALTATGTTMLVVRPGATAVANSVAANPLGLTWDISYTIGGTSPAVTATMSYAYLV